MLQFEKQLIITGAEQKVRKDNTAYTLVHVLGENGATFACVYKGDINKVMSVKKMEKYKEIERSIIKKFRKDIWSKFVKAVAEFELIQENDKIMVCISGGKDSMLMAKLFQELQN